MSGMHFERMAAEYAGARPPYPPGLYDVLAAEGVVGPGIRVLEVGAGSGLATRQLVSAGCEVVAVEPGRELAGLLQEEVPEATVLVTRLEDAELPEAWFDSVVAATSMHWVDLPVGLPIIHAALRPGGWLAVWRHRFGDERVDTPFRRHIARIVGGRDQVDPSAGPRDDRPTMSELGADGWFEPVRSETWRWSLELDTERVRALFRTFSDWSEEEVDAAARGVEELGGTVTEHYQSVLHLLRRWSHGTTVTPTV